MTRIYSERCKNDVKSFIFEILIATYSNTGGEDTFNRTWWSCASYIFKIPIYTSAVQFSSPPLLLSYTSVEKGRISYNIC